MSVLSPQPHSVAMDAFAARCCRCLPERCKRRLGQTVNLYGNLNAAAMGLLYDWVRSALVIVNVRASLGQPDMQLFLHSIASYWGSLVIVMYALTVLHPVLRLLAHWPIFASLRRSQGQHRVFPLLVLAGQGSTLVARDAASRTAGFQRLLRDGLPEGRCSGRRTAYAVLRSYCHHPPVPEQHRERIRDLLASVPAAEAQGYDDGCVRCRGVGLCKLEFGPVAPCAWYNFLLSPEDWTLGGHEGQYPVYYLAFCKVSCWANLLDIAFYVLNCVLVPSTAYQGTWLLKVLMALLGVRSALTTRTWLNSVWNWKHWGVLDSLPEGWDPDDLWGSWAAESLSRFRWVETPDMMRVLREAGGGSAAEGTAGSAGEPLAPASGATAEAVLIEVA